MILGKYGLLMIVEVIYQNEKILFPSNAILIPEHEEKL